MVIVAAVSESEQSRELVAEAGELAEAFGDEVHLVHVVEESEYTRIVERQSESRRTDTGDIARNAALEATDGFDDALAVDYEVVARVGDPGKEVAEYADQVDARYVVVGGRARSPVGKAVFGSITQSIVLNTARPVVTITPDE